jgi:uncharacterized membrane protein YqaE (UPF0057 family)
MSFNSNNISDFQELGNSNNSNNNSGGMGFFDFIFGPILKPLRDIINGALMVVKFLVIIVTKVPEIIATAFTILNPIKLVNDIIIGSVLSMQIIVNGILNRFYIRYYFNKIFETKSNKNNTTNNSRNCKTGNCYSLSTSRLMLTVLCPPVGIFMEYGIDKFFEIFICSILTIYAYYFPGLLFAILMIRQKVNLEVND